MDRDKIRDLLEKVRSGAIDVQDAMLALKMLPYEDLGFARTDSHRALRTGYPEVVYCTGKTTGQICAIVERLAAAHRTIIASRATDEVYEAVKKVRPEAVYKKDARLVIIGETVKPATDKKILVITAGTSDIPVAEEAAVTAEAMANPVERLFDVGVAGIHRLFENAPSLFSANVIIAVAGMEGALPSVIGGLVDRPVIAVPTSIGYGASFGGLSALLTMLNSCAPGVAVVNIDNGFGAGYIAGLINQGAA
ncbi:MAG: 1-(5-phosphoribosyl)-5-amino-4-imidazole-carboxylate carboxylase [Spirochaetes bacterium RBG_13_51_14]|nr:MAG: 1-(5-phosphoribosyl)-5-amino-4-imidazole-carboxylate carboxylase [Spirochaetes bacterium RBG_13_51_14]